MKLIDQSTYSYQTSRDPNQGCKVEKESTILGDQGTLL